MKPYILSFLILFSSFVISGVIPERSRVIFNAKNALQSSVLVNTNNYPVVVQLWVDDGELNKAPEQSTSPFVVTPVISRMEPLKLNEMKLVFSGKKDELPGDRESLFWLNILEIPPVNTNPSAESDVTLSMLTQIKIIYRPESLETNSQKVMQQMAALSFAGKGVNQGALQLTVNNPSPYIANLSAVSLKSQLGGKTSTIKPVGTSNFTLLPKSSTTFNVEKMTQPAAINTIEYWLVDDNGNFFPRSQPVSVSNE